MVDENTVNFVEVLCLGIDAVLFSLFYKLYWTSKRVAESVKGAPVISLSHDATESLKSIKDYVIPYAVIKGTVKAVKQPLHSDSNPLIKGVIQQIVRREHQVKWNWATRWWLESEREVSATKNYVPFLIAGPTGGVQVNVLEPLGANLLDLTTVSDKFEPVSAGFGEAVWGFFTGSRTRGFQTIEQMLLEGASVTGIGQLVRGKDGQVNLYPPGQGMNYYLTQLSEASLVKSLETETSFYKILTALCGLLGTYFIYGIISKSYNQYRKKRALKQRRQLLQDLRERTRTEFNTPTQSPPCVICMANPREVVILECGHVCCCADCAENLTSSCPICRAPITRFWPAYIS